MAAFGEVAEWSVSQILNCALSSEYLSAVARWRRQDFFPSAFYAAACFKPKSVSRNAPDWDLLITDWATPPQQLGEFPHLVLIFPVLDKHQLEVISSWLHLAAQLQSLEARLHGNEWLKRPTKESGWKGEDEQGQYWSKVCGVVFEIFNLKR